MCFIVIFICIIIIQLHSNIFIAYFFKKKEKKVIRLLVQLEDLL